jgi:hypothetical protein
VLGVWKKTEISSCSCRESKFGSSRFWASNYKLRHTGCSIARGHFAIVSTLASELGRLIGRNSGHALTISTRVNLERRLRKSRGTAQQKGQSSIFGRCMPSNTTRQFMIINTLYGQHVSAIAISHQQASHRNTLPISCVCDHKLTCCVGRYTYIKLCNNTTVWTIQI